MLQKLADCLVAQKGAREQATQDILKQIEELKKQRITTENAHDKIIVDLETEKSEVRSALDFLK